MMRQLAGWRDTIGSKTVFLAALAALFVLHFPVLSDPPYWDALMGAFPQASWLADHGLNGWELLTTQRTYVDGGPNVYPFSLYPYLAAALYALELAPASVFFVLHVASFVCAAAAVSALFRVARRHLPPGGALLLSLAFFSVPLTVSMACQLSLDMPLTACSALSFAALDEKRFRAAFAWAALALLVKPTAIILIAANLALLAVIGFTRIVDASAEEKKGARGCAGAHLALCFVFALELFLLSRLARSPAYVDPLGGWSVLFGRRLWVIPEYGLGLVIFLASLPFAAVRLARREMSWIELECCVFLLVFVLFYGQYTNTLPRYFLQSFPFLLLYLALRLYRFERAGRLREGVLMIAIAGFLLNQAGRFYPSRASGWHAPGDTRAIAGNDGYILERSLEYRQDLALNQEIARRLEKYPRASLVIVANWPLVHVLAFPRLGYVERPFRVCSPDNRLLYDQCGVAYGDVYDTSASPPRQKTRDTVLWALTPNTFNSPQTTLATESDDVVESVESGSHRAFIVRRRAWE